MLRNAYRRSLFFLVFGPLLLATVSHAQGHKVDAAAIVKAHNAARAKVGSPRMKWSSDLEALAARRIKVLEQNGCFMKHQGPGENLFWASARQTANRRNAFGQWIWRRSVQQVSENEVVNRWASEKKWYSYEQGVCFAPAGESCGHYTQIVWDDSVEVGCSRAVCPDQSQVWLCVYSPPGNVRGERPY